MKVKLAIAAAVTTFFWWLCGVVSFGLDHLSESDYSNSRGDNLYHAGIVIMSVTLILCFWTMKLWYVVIKRWVFARKGTGAR
jgi:hypothetical protein